MTTTTLSNVLFGNGENGEQALRLRLPNLLGRRLPVAIGPRDLPAEVAAAITALLAMPVRNLAMTAWEKHRQVQAARDQTARHPHGRQVVRLVEHTIRSEQHPAIDLDVEGTRHRLLTLTLRVELEITAANLVVEKGQIASAQPASATASATLLAGEICLATGTLATVDLYTHA